MLIYNQNKAQNVDEVTRKTFSLSIKAQSKADNFDPYEKKKQIPFNHIVYGLTQSRKKTM